MFSQHARHLGEKIREQLIGGRKRLGPARVGWRPVPMIGFDAALPEPRSQRRHAVGVIEAHEPVALGIMQGEGVAKPMRTLGRSVHALDLKFQPIALFEMMDAPIERQQELKRVFVRNRPPPYLFLS